MAEEIPPIIKFNPNKVMDVSEKYILMCQGAEEVQAIKTARLTDLNVCYDDVLRDDAGNITYGVRRLIPEVLVLRMWLPRQEQLQKQMINDEKDFELTIPKLVNRLTKVMQVYASREGFYEPTSLEQWWLIVFMIFTFEKEWDGSGWVAITHVYFIEENV